MYQWERTPKALTWYQSHWRFSEKGSFSIYLAESCLIPAPSLFRLFLVLRQNQPFRQARHSLLLIVVLLPFILFFHDPVPVSWQEKGIWCFVDLASHPGSFLLILSCFTYLILVFCCYSIGVSLDLFSADWCWSCYLLIDREEKQKHWYLLLPDLRNVYRLSAICLSFIVAKQWPVIYFARRKLTLLLISFSSRPLVVFFVYWQFRL